MGYVILDALKVPKVTLHVYKGQDLYVDVRWWADEGKTVPMILSGAQGQIRSEAGELLLDLAPTPIDNAAVIRVPSTALSDLPEQVAKWDLEAVAAGSGQRKTLVRGPVRIYEEVTR